MNLNLNLNLDLEPRHYETFPDTIHGPLITTGSEIVHHILGANIYARHILNKQFML